MASLLKQLNKCIGFLLVCLEKCVHLTVKVGISYSLSYLLRVYTGTQMAPVLYNCLHALSQGFSKLTGYIRKPDHGS